MLSERVNYLMAAFDLHLGAGKEPVAAWNAAQKDYVRVYHSGDEDCGSPLSRAADVALEHAGALIETLLSELEEESEPEFLGMYASDWYDYRITDKMEKCPRFLFARQVTNPYTYAVIESLEGTTHLIDISGMTGDSSLHISVSIEKEKENFRAVARCSLKNGVRVGEKLEEGREDSPCPPPCSCKKRI